MTHYGVCDRCFEPVTSETAKQEGGRPAFPIMGWEVLREQGGANQIRNRERVPGSVRHERCLPNERENHEQQSLL